MADTLDIEGIDVETFFSKITGAGITEAEAKVLVGTLLIRDKITRRFRYATAFPAEDPACTPAFNRSFNHVDWVDGESVVQAEETTGEAGFNLRFHRIEGDLDALGADLALVFACLAGMRRSLRSLLDEIKVEFDRLNALMGEREPGPIVQPFPKPGIEFLGTTKVGNIDKYILREGDEYRLVDLGPLVNPVGPVPDTWINDVPPDRLIDTLGEATEMVRNTPELSEAVHAGATVDDIRARFGNAEVATLPGGTPLLLGEILEVVPGTTTFVDAADPAAAIVSAAVASTSEARTGALREIVLKEAARDRTGTELLASDPAVLAPVSRDFARKLRSAGIDDVDALARASGPELVAAMTSAGIPNVDPARVSRAIASARLARSVGRIG